MFEGWDLIFCIYLFQRYKYKIDYSRVNDYGQCVQPTEEMLAEAAREKEEEAAATGARNKPLLEREEAQGISKL